MRCDTDLNMHGKGKVDTVQSPHCNKNREMEGRGRKLLPSKEK